MMAKPYQYDPNALPLTHGPGFRQGMFGNPTAPQGYGWPNLQRGPVVNQQINQQAPQTQQQQIPQGLGMEALVQALTAQQANQAADRYQQKARGSFAQRDTGKAVLFGGIESLLGAQQGKRANKATIEAARLEEERTTAQMEAQAKAAAQRVLANGGTVDQADAEYSAVKAGLKAEFKGSGRMSPEEIMKMADNIHDDTKQMTAEFRQAKVIAGQLSDKILGARNGATEVLALYSFIKSIDPGSVVRPGETEMVSAASSLLNQFETKYRNITKDTMMSDVMYNDLTNLVKQLNQMQVESYRRGFEYEISRAEEMGVPPTMVFGREFLADLYSGKVPTNVPEKPGGTKPKAEPSTYQPGDTLPDGSKILEIIDG